MGGRGPTSSSSSSSMSGGGSGGALCEHGFCRDCVRAW
jgi:hypothetical protein